VVTAALGGDGAMSDWQPIETAPKDGTYILLFVRTSWGGPEIHKACWEDNTYDVKCEAWCIANSTDRDYNTSDEVECPTHWMPLPAPPEAA
jgi:hypothetical protein